MLRLLAAGGLVLSFAGMALPVPAHAQTQKYEPWVYEQMVPTGPHLRNLDQAQPLPEERPSHWGGVNRRLGTDVTPPYSQKNRLNLGPSNNRTPSGNPPGASRPAAGQPGVFGIASSCV